MGGDYPPPSEVLNTSLVSRSNPELATLLMIDFKIM